MTPQTPPMDEWDAKAVEITGPCVCHISYASRELKDPACVYCDIGWDIATALRQAAAKGRVAGYLIGQEHMRNFAANQVAGLKGESLTGSWDMACEEIEATIRALPITEDEPTS